MIREKDMGMSITDISKDMEISGPTVRKYLKGKKPPEYIKKNRVSKLEPYKAYIKERIGVMKEVLLTVIVC